MATQSEIDQIRSYYGNQAEAGTYQIDGKDIEYGGPTAQPTAESTAEDIDKRTTPDSWDGPEDARSMDGAGQYPNYYSHKTRSGHVFMMDDSNGAEHVTVQHRSGSMIQFLPDGKVNITSHNGQYNIVFGENRMLVTGAHDITVNGDASLRVDGDYNVAVQGDVNFSAQGDLNFAAKNVNTLARGNIDISAMNRSEKVSGSITQQAQGAQSILAETGMTIGATTGGLALFGGTMVGIVAKVGAIMMRGLASISMKTAGYMSSEALGATSIMSGGAVIVNAGGAASIKALGATSIEAGGIVSVSAVGEVGVSSGAAVDIKAGGVASFGGGAGTNVNASFGPLNLWGTPILQNVAPFTIVPFYVPSLPYIPALDPLVTFVHLPAPPAIPDPETVLTAAGKFGRN